MITSRLLSLWPAQAVRRFIQRGHHRHPVVLVLARGVGVFAIAAVGLCLGIVLFGSITADIGPFHARFSLVPSLTGGTEVTIPPLGALEVSSHRGPVHLRIQLEALDEAKTRDLVNNPDGVIAASDTAVEDLASGTRQLAMHAAGAGLLAAMAFGALVYRSMRRVALVGGVAVATLAASGVIVTLTFRPDAIQEPRYRGLLTNAPAVVGDVRRIADQYEEYRDQLQRLVQNVSRLYGTISALPVYEADEDTTRVLHISDMHLNPAAWSVITTVVQQFSIDVVVDTGDLTDWGSEPESSYVESIAKLQVPYLYVRGNHDSTRTEEAVSRQHNATALTNSIVTVHGLTFAGLGDPRFTPDKTAGDRSDHELVRDVGASLAGRIRLSDVTVDVAMVHDPVSAELLAFTCPVVLAGHTHDRQVRRIDGPPGSPTDHRSLLMVEGSTGGAGLRGLERTAPLALSLSVLYFDEYRSLQAYDDIEVGGTGLSQVALKRHIVAPDDAPGVARSRSSSSQGE